ncbi:hypothetical protein Hanom_Chr14g01253551 [Helianthus anomalus]
MASTCLPLPEIIKRPLPHSSNLMNQSFINPKSISPKSRDAHLSSMIDEP